MGIQLQSSRRLYSSTLVASVLVLVFGKALAESVNGAASDKAPATAQEPTHVDAMEVCSGSGEAMEPNDRFPAAINAQLGKSDDRIDGQDWSGQYLAGKNLRGKVLVRVSLKNAKLQKADLSGAIICGSDFSGADLSGADLEQALIAGGSKLDGSNLTNASARGLTVADASYENLRIDGADLREAKLVCESDEVRCISQEGDFVSMVGADLRGATVAHLWHSVPGLAKARLAGLSTRLDALFQENYSELAQGVGPNGTMTLFPSSGYSGGRTEFSAEELAQIPAVIEQMRAASAHPSFECSKARSSVEKTICADPALAALDAAMNWLWQRVKHSPAQMEAQKQWLASRGTCPPLRQAESSDDPFDDFVGPAFRSPANPDGCIGIAYARRIKGLAPQSSLSAVQSGTYTTDPPLELPPGNSALARKYLRARGYRQDEITVENWGGGVGKIAGEGTWANGHMCGFESFEKDTKRTGSHVQIFDEAPVHDEKYSVSFVITPQVAIWVGGQKQFQCGARGGWSVAYFRQPDNPFAAVTKPERKADQP